MKKITYTRPKTIIFDMDGVIIDSEPTWHKAMDIFMREVGVPSYDRVTISKATTGMKENESAEVIKNTYNLPHSIEEIADKRLGIVRDLHATETVLFPGAQRILAELEMSGYDTALATSSAREIADYILGKFKLRPYFDYTITANDVKKGKPHPEMYQKIAKRMGKKPEECIVIEDSLHGIDAARGAGMKVVAVRHDGIFKDEEMLKKNPDKFVQCIDDLCVDDFLEL